jgi:hypothetical protein
MRGWVSKYKIFFLLLSSIYALSSIYSAPNLSVVAAVPNFCEGRLTLTSGVPVTSNNIYGAGNLYFTPYLGNKIAVYNGARWVLYEFTEISIDLSGVAPDKIYDVFARDNAGVLELGVNIWADDTARNDVVKDRDGIYILDGPGDRRYLGTFRTDGAGTLNDAENIRTLWNYYNRVPRTLYMKDPNNLWTNSSKVWDVPEGDPGNSVEIVNGMQESSIEVAVVAMSIVGAYTSVDDLIRRVGIGVNSTTVNSAQQTGTTASYQCMDSITAMLRQMPALGRVIYYWLETANLGPVPSTFYGNGSPDYNSGITGIWEG